MMQFWPPLIVRSLEDRRKRRMTLVVLPVVQSIMQFSPAVCPHCYFVVDLEGVPVGAWLATISNIAYEGELFKCTGCGSLVYTHPPGYPPRPNGGFPYAISHATFIMF